MESEKPLRLILRLFIGVLSFRNIFFHGLHDFFHHVLGSFFEITFKLIAHLVNMLIISFGLFQVIKKALENIWVSLDVLVNRVRVHLSFGLFFFMVGHRFFVLIFGLLFFGF